jgi:CMP-N-acetylneuraminic acid synthetase
MISPICGKNQAQQFISVYMKVIIPCKKSSSRVPEKNWRPFYDDQSLTEVKIKQVKKVIDGKNIYLSCDDASKQKTAEALGVQFILREPHLASDDTAWSDAFRGIIKGTPFADEEDVAWVEVVNPLFDNFEELFKKWEEVKTAHDSLVLGAPFNKFLLKGDGKPLNFQFGKWHAMSQFMEPFFAWDSVCIMTKKNMLYFSYPIGRNPYIFSTRTQCIDIDTQFDFDVAQFLYKRKAETENQLRAT